MKKFHRNGWYFSLWLWTNRMWPGTHLSGGGTHHEEPRLLSTLASSCVSGFLLNSNYTVFCLVLLTPADELLINSHSLSSRLKAGEEAMASFSSPCLFFSSSTVLKEFISSPSPRHSHLFSPLLFSACPLCAAQFIVLAGRKKRGIV